MKLKHGYIQVYTGNGKGKTTAALGLALRAAGAGLKVYIVQFIKNGRYSEIRALKKHKNIKVEQFGKGCLIRKPKKIDMDCAKNGLKHAEKIISGKTYDIVILDEINVALYLKLITIADVIKILRKKPRSTEIILTGRYAPKKIIDMADLVTEMKDKRHYYNNGVKARIGIER